MKKQIEVFEQEYERFLMLAGSEDKIAFAVRNIMNIFEATTAAITKLYDDIYVIRGKETRHESQQTTTTAART